MHVEIQKMWKNETIDVVSTYEECFDVVLITLSAKISRDLK